MLTIYNTLTKKEEVFKPIKKGEVGLYGCGPTVYWYQHIGNIKRYIFEDILARTILYNGYKLKHVINVTDVGHLTSDADEGEDKMEKAAAKEGKKASDIADFYFKVFKEDLEKVNILEPNIWCKATDHIKEQINLVKMLEKKGFTYITTDGVYFNTAKLKDYGKLAKLKKEKIEAGKRVSVKEKKNSTDFALWKFSEAPGVRQQEWESPWGIGFPGWHIECSAMSTKYLGQPFDIHTGGQEHIQVHHTNEIAQSEAANNKKFVNYWMHSAWLINKEGDKISKSTGGLYTISELEKQGYDPLIFRYFCLLTHYRKPQVFTMENLDAAKNTYERIKRKVQQLKEKPTRGKDLSKKYQEDFLKAINSDLNTPAAIQVMIKALDDPSFSSKAKLKLLNKFDKVLGLNLTIIKEEKTTIPEEVQNLLKEREVTRKNKDWTLSDQLRDQIKQLGFAVKDTPEGQVLEKL